MKKLTIEILFLALVVMLSSCKEEEVKLQCDDSKNGQVTRADNTYCASYYLNRYWTTETGENIEIDVAATNSWASGFIKINLADRLLTEGTYSQEDGEFRFSFPNNGNVTSNTLTITSLNRENKTMSGYFTFEGTLVENFTEYDVTFEGEFTDVIFIE